MPQHRYADQSNYVLQVRARRLRGLCTRCGLEPPSLPVEACVKCINRHNRNVKAERQRKLDDARKAAAIAERHRSTLRREVTIQGVTYIVQNSYIAE